MRSLKEGSSSFSFSSSSSSSSSISSLDCSSNSPSLLLPASSPSSPSKVNSSLSSSLTSSLAFTLPSSSISLATSSSVKDKYTQGPGVGPESRAADLRLPSRAGLLAISRGSRFALSKGGICWKEHCSQLLANSSNSSSL